MRIIKIPLNISKRLASSSGAFESVKEVEVKIQIPGSSSALELKTGHLARFASSAVVASVGENAILATVVQKKANKGNGNGTPLTVEYRPSASAVGRIPTNFLRRELSNSDTEILLARAIDRSIRPLISPYSFETQVVCKPLVLDQDGDQLMMAINAASAALHISSIPYEGPMAALRIVMNKSGEISINPSYEQMQDSVLNMIVSMRNQQKVVMIELEADEVSIEKVEAALDVGFREVEHVLAAMDQLRNDVGNNKDGISNPQEDPEIANINELLEKFARERIYYVMTDSTHDKTSRDRAIKSILDSLTKLDDFKPLDYNDVASCFYNLSKNVLRSTVLQTGYRCDGRKVNEFRPIKIHIDMYKKLHGCSLFQRGQTQVLSSVSFDSPTAAFHPDSVAQLLGTQRKKQFMLHYEFPGYATNEIGLSRTANRREIGHGALAEKGLKNLFPKDFPYAVRLACQVLESNGSSSMASICGGSLALFDAGVPMKNAAAGVAIGLITNEESPETDYKVLTDILGIEDYAGDMDFKIAGTKDGLTAAQMDVKIGGLTREQFSKSLIAGKEGIAHVLQKMNVMRDRPRDEFKPTVPVIETMRLEPHKRVALFRNNGYNCKLVESETGVKISSVDETSVSLLAQDKERMGKAKELMKTLMEQNETLDFAFGTIISAEIVEIVERGIFVTLPKSSRRIFMSNAHLSSTAIRDARVLGLKVGEKTIVTWYGRDEHTGNIRLSRRNLTGATGATVSK